jgi:hypothetical protein
LPNEPAGPWKPGWTPWSVWKKRSGKKDLAEFYAYLHEMGKGAIPDPEEQEEQLAIVKGWAEDARFLAEILEEKTA